MPIKLEKEQEQLCVQIQKFLVNKHEADDDRNDVKDIWQSAWHDLINSAKDRAMKLYACVHWFLEKSTKSYLNYRADQHYAGWSSSA